MSLLVRAFEDSFNACCDLIFKNLSEDEQAVCNLTGEESLFVRINHGQVRQNTFVQQGVLSLQLQTPQQVGKCSWSLTGNVSEDLRKTQIELHLLRSDLKTLPISPFVTPITNEGHSRTEVKTGEDSLQHVEKILAEIVGLEVVGLYAGGTQFIGNRNSLGQNHWYSSESFFFDYSIYEGFKAVKELYSDSHWDGQKFSDQIRLAKQKIEKLKIPARKISPGEMDVYLAPSAVNEIFGLLNWNGWSRKAFETSAHPFKLLAEKKKFFSPAISIRENFELGWASPFNELGQKSKAHVPLIKEGHLQQLLINQRTAKEFHVQHNAALDSESTRSLEMSPGKLKESEILNELGSGLYLSNLHYLNWSDIQQARLTGMTRFACFLVENGELVCPVQDLRFDVSLYDVWGSHLKGITDFVERQPGVSTYIEREHGGRSLPGLLVKKWNFTL